MTSRRAGAFRRNRNALRDYLSALPTLVNWLLTFVPTVVTAPIIAKDLLNVKLPKTESGDGKGMSTLALSINRQGQILLSGVPVSEEVLREETRKALAKDRETQAIIAGQVSGGRCSSGR